MDPVSDRLHFLLDRYINNLVSEEETKEFFALLRKQEPDDLVKMKLHELWQGYKGSEPLPATDWNSMYEQIVSVPVIRKKHFAASKLAIAVAVLLLLGSGIFYFIYQDNKQDKQLAVDQRMPPANDALPGQNKATLRLANGQVIVLDSAALGKLTEQGGMDVLNKENGLAYTGERPADEIIYNTLVTNRGEQYSLTLADGTKAWLNAASSIRFPVSFAGNERIVEITGEVYFEVAHNPQKPFVVKKPGKELAVQVLGTHFNVNAYDDEEMIKVSLLEGSVKVSSRQSTVNSQQSTVDSRQSAVLKPGQQAQVTNVVKVVNGIDLESVMSWKNGYFSFSHTDLPSMLRQLSRWYDVEVVFETDVPEMKIGGGITRNTNLSQVLKILEELKVKFRVEGKKLIVRK